MLRPITRQEIVERWLETAAFWSNFGLALAAIVLLLLAVLSIADAAYLYTYEVENGALPLMSLARGGAFALLGLLALLIASLFSYPFTVIKWLSMYVWYRWIVWRI